MLRWWMREEISSAIRMDGAWLGSIDISINKAFTARAFDISIAELAGSSQPGQQFFGIHVSNHGRIIGAIGVSGGSGTQDDAVARAGACALTGLRALLSACSESLMLI